MQEKLSLPYAEFYITNVCNLSCQGCNRFNDKKFKGWQSWHEYADVYAQWSQQLELDHMAIIGGEPFLNPTFYEWAKGLANLWPNSKIKIATNGTQFDKNHKFYNILREYPKIELNVSLHNKVVKKSIIQSVENFLQAPFKYLFDATPYAEMLTITDANGVIVNIRYNWWFHQGAVITDDTTGDMTLHQSDPIKAHDICHSKECHHFENGKLYKCGPASLFAQFDTQFGLKLSDPDRALINNYTALSVDDDIGTKKRFIDDLANPIAQCRFCPEVYVGNQIFAQEKKVFFKK